MCGLSGKYYDSYKGSVLILVLVVISAMTAIAFGLAVQTRIEIRLSNSSSQEAVLRNLAFSGFEAAKAILSEKELDYQQTAKVCKFYSSNDTLRLLEQLKPSLDSSIQVAFWIKDENSFLDINKSNPVIWEKLPFFDRDKSACIMDWIDSDSDTNPDGAESDYYESLEFPYVSKNASLVCLKEALFVKNITREDYLGDFLKEQELNLDEIENIFYNNSQEQMLFINTFTTFGQSTININTVSGEILSVLPGLDQELADIVLAYRNGTDCIPNTDDDRFFEKAEDFLQIEGLSELSIGLLNEYCCFNSDTFRVFSLAKNSRQTYLAMVTIKVSENKPQVICAERLL